MKLRPVALALCALAFAGVATAETVVVDEQVQVRESSVARPARGMTMKAVESKFGTPASRHDAVGKPPITRWDYPAFSVFFEHDRVIHAVATGG
jgi:outer membrane protein assembly factor BamE (lipoprotein component of BamABCDE complex)